MDLLEIFFLEKKDKTYYKIRNTQIILLDMPFEDVKQSLTERYEGYYVKFIADSSLENSYLKNVGQAS
jgi:hypothetical protein